MIRDNKDNKKVLVLICYNNIKLQEAQLYMFFHGGYAVNLYGKNQVHGWQHDQCHPSLIQHRIPISTFNKLLQYIFCNIWGLSVHPL